MTKTLENITPQQIAARAWILFGTPYQAILIRRMTNKLTVDQRACLVDMECIAENELMRERGYREDDTKEQTGLL